LKERLIRLLGIEAISVNSKAMALAYEHEHIFQSARIFTDIRPIFGYSVQDVPNRYIFFHTLKIRYTDDGRMKELFLALDTADLQNMIEVLERAKMKVESLKSAFDGVGLQYVGED
jgi:hypothetical protein